MIFSPKKVLLAESPVQCKFCRSFCSSHLWHQHRLPYDLGGWLFSKPWPTSAWKQHQYVITDKILGAGWLQHIIFHMDFSFPSKLEHSNYAGGHFHLHIHSDFVFSILTRDFIWSCYRCRALPVLVGNNRVYRVWRMLVSYYLPGNSLALPPSHRVRGVTAQEVVEHAIWGSAFFQPSWAVTGR